MSGRDKNKAANPDHVPFGKLLAWQMRPISLGAVTIITMYLSLYCTDTLGMPAALVGTLLMASKIFDGVTDIFAGWLIDNTKTKWGKARPYELSIIGVWVCMFALFATSDTWSMTAKSAWLFIMYTLIFSVFQTLLNAAETPYIIRAFKTPLAVTKVSAYGGIIVTLGSMVISVSFPILVGTMGNSTAGWRKLIAMYAIPLVCLGLLRFLFVKEENDVVEDNKDDRVKIKDILQVITSNKYVWLMGLACMVPQLATSLSAGTYYFTWIVGDIGKYSAIQMVSMLSLILIILFPTLMKKFSAMQLIGASAVIAIAGYVLCFFSGANMLLIAVGFFLSSMITLPTSYMKAPIIMQISDYNEYNGKPRMEATMAAVANFLNKIGSAFGSFLLGIMLTMGGYDGNLDVQPDGAIMMIRLLFSFVPAAIMVVVIICTIAFRPLDKFSREKEMQSEA
ncbi:MAG: MFS transporter [Lachnospiraceae bacterium]|nr:MFS transporter [Lachnospiraceae bacterium]